MIECARRDAQVPLEETLETVAELEDEGKISGVALSEVSADMIRKAAKIRKTVTVKVELSLLSTEPLANSIADACTELHTLIFA